MTTMQLHALDLNTDVPRSPNALLGDFVLVPRILDKCRATLAGTNGLYNFNCPLDRHFFDYFEVDADAFKAQVAQGKTDDEMLAWINAHRAPKSQDEIFGWSYAVRWAAPTEPEKMSYFESIRRKVALDKPYIQTWFQLLDADEGRL